jgi:hypothetical protein
MSHLKLVVDNSAIDDPGTLHEECDLTGELELQIDQLQSTLDRLRLETAVVQERFEEPPDPEIEVFGLRLATWIRLGIIALCIWASR